MSRAAVELQTESRTAFDVGALGLLLDGRLRYCVLHGWDRQATRRVSDLDIAVAPADLRGLEEALGAGREAQILQLIQHEATGFYFVLAHERGGEVRFTAVDAAADYRLGGRVFFRAADLLRGSRTLGGVRVAAPQVEFAYLLVKKVSKGALPPGQRTRLRSLYMLLGERAREVAVGIFGRRAGSEVVECLAGCDWERLEAELPRLGRALRAAAMARDPLNAIRYWGPDLYRRWRRFRQPTGMWLAVLGPDGAGKSTLIDSLRRQGSAAFRRTDLFHLRARLSGREVQRGPLTDPHRNPPHPAWLSLLKLAYYALAYVAGYVAIVRPRLVRSTLVLFDRYYDDLLVDPRRYRYGGWMKAARLARAFVPRPDLFLVLDAPGPQLHDRKPEVAPDELRRQRAAYLALAIESGNSVLLDASLPAGEVARTANHALVAYLHERYVNRRRQWFGRDRSDRTLEWLTSVLCASPEASRFAFRASRRTAPAAPAAERFGWLSLGDGRAYLIPLRGARAALRALDLYNARSARAGAAKRLLAAALRLGFGGRLIANVDLRSRRDAAAANGGPGHILDHLKQVLGRPDLRFGISVGTPGLQRKPVLLVLAESGEPLAYVKIGASPLSNALVRREAEALQFLAAHPCRSFTAPAVLHAGCWQGRELVVQSVCGQRAQRTHGGPRCRYADIPKELAHLNTRWMPLTETPFWRDMLRRIEAIPTVYYRETLGRAARDAAGRLAAGPLPFHLSHGDFTSWNTRCQGDTIHLFDWELSRDEDLPAHDVFHYHFQEMRCVQRREIEEIYLAFFREPWLRGEVTMHLAALGAAGLPVEPLFLLYRVDQLANEAAEIRADVPTFREVAMVGKMLKAV